ncbi:beta-N-acetylhexosaminidase [uncultured Roseovarius sp.]|uniref:beta-N-acetylhexosaminidase n=1 Tax=uncultured Roseovarius sp. TaxID=293344 RepID=UPI00261493A7|nr:beta-N-acetylhexosaminidase [uncultured Roseovarius sp.]
MTGYGATILDAEGLRLTREEKAFFRDARPFGFILFARNIDAPDQVRALCAEMREAAGHNAMITIDQEGGRVQRLRAPQWRDWPAPLDQAGQAGARATDAMYLRYRIIASELHALGIDSNCAPLVDVAGPETHAFLRNRCFGDEPQTVARLGRAVADGLLDGGVLPVIKHIPGHGRAKADSHHDLPVVTASREMLNDADFVPFKELNDLPMAMTAHLVYSTIDPEPATLSPPILEVIRGDIGFDGLIMTDDISMKALQGGLADLSRRALDAGCDVILHCNGALSERQSVAEAAGEMTEAAQIRAERVLTWRKPPAPVDIPALSAQLDALMGGHGNG